MNSCRDLCQITKNNLTLQITRHQKSLSNKMGRNTDAPSLACTFSHCVSWRDPSGCHGMRGRVEQSDSWLPLPPPPAWQLLVSHHLRFHLLESSTLSIKKRKQKHLLLQLQCSEDLSEAVNISCLDDFIVLPIGLPTSCSLCNPPAILLPK